MAKPLRSDLLDRGADDYGAGDAEALYESVARRIERLIDDSTYRPQEKLPSLRQLHVQWGVSIATVMQAYLLLERRGKIEARPKSGFYVKPPEVHEAARVTISKTKKSLADVRIVDLHREIIAAARDKRMVPFGAATPDPELLPHAALNRMLASTARRLGAESNAYDLPPGNDRLRRILAKRAIGFGCTLNPEGLLTTCGASEGLHLALRAVVTPGDIVAIESPAYFGVLEVLESLSVRVVEIPACPQAGIDLAALTAALDRYRVSAVVAMPNFSNPLGSQMPDEKKQDLVRILTKRDIPLIEDDIYGDLPFNHRRPTVAKSYDTKDLVILCSSFSKTLAPGYRVGWIAPGRYFDRVMALKMMTSIATPTLPQLAIAEFLQDGGYDRHVRKLQRVFETQVLQMAQAVMTFFPAGTKVTSPLGGFVLWVEMPPEVDSLTLFESAVQKGIGFSPGPLFSPHQGLRNFLRINCGYQWSPRIERAVHTLGGLAKQQAG